MYRGAAAMTCVRILIFCLFRPITFDPSALRRNPY
jgi:hypothetical protein